MTKAGKSWLWEQGINRSASDAERAIRAFCDEVEKMALRKCEDGRTIPCTACKSYAFDELKRELLGTSDAS